MLVAIIGSVNDGVAPPAVQKSFCVAGVEFTLIVALTCVKAALTTNTSSARYLIKAAASNLKDDLDVEANLLLVIFTIFVQGAKI